MLRTERDFAADLHVSEKGRDPSLRSGQAPSTSITAGHEASTGTAGAKALML